MGEIKWTTAQRNAIDASNLSIAVSAAAGSGKTTVLTRRITERICSGEIDVSRILVVTFTRAAAAELVEKISKSLEDLYNQNPSDKHLLKQLLLLPSAKISTIDGFCLDIVRENFQETGISGFGTMDADAEKILKEEVADELISDYFDGTVVGDGKIDDFPAFADTFGSPSSDSLLKERMVSLHMFYSGCINREKAIKGESSGEDFANSFWGNAIYGLVKEFLQYYINFYRIAIDEIDATRGAESRRPSYKKESDFCLSLYNKLTSGAPYAEIRDCLAGFEETIKESSGSVKKEHQTPALNAYREIRSKFKSKLAEIRSKYFSLSEQDLAETLSRASLMQDNLIRFLNEFDRRLMEEKKRRHMFGFADIARFALNLLYDEKNDAPTAAAREISDRFSEIYIDEFQDTNELQNKIFTLIAKENNLFTVGDKKQSIYDFRGAEPAIFDRQLTDRKKYGEHGENKAAKVFLSENFRSGKKVIDIVNGIFSVLMNTDGETVYGADEQLVCHQTDIVCPQPEMHIICTSDDNPSLTEEAYVAEKISALIASGETAANDIAVLLRTDKIAMSLSEELSKRGVLCRNASIKGFFESPEVLLVLSLLNTIDNPSRDVYLAATLKSPIYGVTLDELLRIKRENPSGSLHSALKEYTEKHNFEKGKRFFADMEKFRSKAKICTCGELLKEVYAETKITSILGREVKCYENLRRLYDYALNFESGGNKGLYSFISFVNEIINTQTKIEIPGFGGTADAVTIMTMHASKGLEFDTVFLCDTKRQTNTEYTRGSVLAVRNTPIAFDLYENDNGGKIIDTPMHRAAVDLQSGRLAEEACRLLYVALTRAKRRLVITAAVNDVANTSGKAKSPEEKFDFTDATSSVSIKSKLFSSYSRKKCLSMLDWICIGLAQHPELCSIDFVRGLPDRAAVPSDEGTGGEDNYEKGLAIVRERLGFEYPHKILSRIPSKLSVSRLYPDALDEGDEAVARLDGTPAVPDEEKSESYPAPVFIAGETESGASHGTAMHTFMQFFDFESVDKNGVEAEIKRLAENKFIFESDREKLNIRKLEKFFSSPLASVMRNADRIYREKRFIIFYPAERFSEDEETKKALAGERLMVQGVIDCAVKTKSGELILIDYKTDFFPAGTEKDEIKKTLIQRHSRQLGYYKYACEKLFGKAPEHTYIYSFALDDAIEL